MVRRRDKFHAMAIGICHNGAAAPLAIRGRLDDRAAGLDKLIEIGIERIDTEADADACGGARLGAGGIDFEDVATGIRLGGEMLGAGTMTVAFEEKSEHAIEALGSIEIRGPDDNEIQ